LTDVSFTWADFHLSCIYYQVQMPLFRLRQHHPDMGPTSIFRSAGLSTPLGNTITDERNGHRDTDESTLEMRLGAAVERPGLRGERSVTMRRPDADNLCYRHFQVLVISMLWRVHLLMAQIRLLIMGIFPYRQTRIRNELHTVVYPFVRGHCAGQLQNIMAQMDRFTVRIIILRGAGHSGYNSIQGTGLCISSIHCSRRLYCVPIYAIWSTWERRLVRLFR